MILLLRAVSLSVALVLATAYAWLCAALALAAVVWRRAPVGVRLRPLRAREARVIPFQRARQKALSR